MRLVNILLQVEQEFAEVLMAVSVREAQSNPGLRAQTRHVAKLMVDIAAIKRALASNRLAITA